MTTARIRRFVSSALVIVLAVVASNVMAQELRVGLFRLPNQLDVGFGLSNPDHALPYSLFDSLIQRDHYSEAAVYLPGLATEWRYLAEDLLELDLRQGVLFHDGSEFTAADVKFSIERLSDPDYPSTFVYNIAFAVIEEVEIVDSHTVRLHLAKPDPAILAILSMPQAAIVPEAYTREVGFDAFGQAPIGTGPYKLVSFTPGDIAVVERFDGFWGEAAPAERITFRAIPELVTRMTALSNGEVDIITHVPTDQVATINNLSCCAVEGLLTPLFHVLYLNPRNPAIADARVRQALSLAIDRELLNQAFWGGGAVVPHGHQFPLYRDYYDENRPAMQYDPERARQLLAEAGYAGEPVTFGIQDGYYTNGLLTAQAVVEMWQAVGFEASVHLNPETPITDINNTVRAWSNPVYFADPAGSYGVMYAPEGIARITWTGEHPEYAEMYEAFRWEQDPDARRALYGQVLDYWEAFVPGILLYQPIEYYGVSERVDWRPLPGTQPYILDFRSGSLKFN